MSEAQLAQVSYQEIFNCDSDYLQRNACRGENFYNEHEGKRYCILHYPAEKDAQRFNLAIERKWKAEDFDFSGVYFSDSANFRSWVFAKDADFSNATFNGKADFSTSQFRGKAEFRAATFHGYANFGSIWFHEEVVFSEANFNQQAVFAYAKFEQKAGFHFSWFHQRADFGSSVFNAAALFNSTEFKKESYFYKAKFLQPVEFNNAKFAEEACFYSVKFDDKAAFGGAKFDGVADFNDAEFKSTADFGLAEFAGQTRFFTTNFAGEADFKAATFKEMTNFMSAKFGKNADFGSANFNSPVYFDNASFAGDAGFSHATFKDVARFSSNEKINVFADGASLNLEFARIDKPERIAFHGLKLRPHWFVNVDSRKFEFLDVTWLNEINWSRTFSPKAELKSLAGKVSAPHRLLSVTYRQLAVNAEENHRYGEALKLRYASMESHRLETSGGFIPWKLNWWYWLASGYGESAVRAVLVFAVLVSLFTFSYTKTDFDHSSKSKPVQSFGDSADKPNLINPLNWEEAVVYSLNVAILQKPEPKPFSTSAKLLVWLETVLGPAQAALLALAVRRRFMR